MYLYFFEKIVRAQVIADGGPADWALPYWNYDGGASQNQIPFAFRSPTKMNGAANALYVGKRNTSVNNGGGLSSLITTPAFALSRPLFTGKTEFGGGIPSIQLPFVDQTGRLEQTPHNDVHNTIGGLMGAPETAAMDPIFWLHHANIDRIWWLWQKSHKNPTDPTWLNTPFEFVNETGALANLTAADVQDITAQLGYQYDLQFHKPVPPLIVVLPLVRWPGPWPEFKRPLESLESSISESLLVGASKDVVKLVGERTTVPVLLDDRTMRELVKRAEFRPQGRMFLEIENVTSKRNPDFVYGIFINLPRSAGPKVLELHHVGNLSLFGIERANAPLNDKHAHAFGISMEITHVLDKLALEGSWLDGRSLDVTFLPITIDAPADSREAVRVSTYHHDFPVQIGRISLRFV
jgi:tyrosinase